MSRLVSGVITEARDRHATFDVKRQPEGPLYRFLAAYCQELQGKITAIDPAYSGFETTLTYQLPLDDFNAGLALGANRLVSDILYADPETVSNPRTWPVSLLSRAQRHAVNRPFPFAWQEGERLYLGGGEVGWRGLGGTVQVRVTQPFGDVDITDLQSPLAVLPVPDECATAVIENLAAFMGRRSSPAIDLTGIAREAEASALVACMQRLVGTVVFTSDDWHP